MRTTAGGGDPTSPPDPQASTSSSTPSGTSCPNYVSPGFFQQCSTSHTWEWCPLHSLC